MLILPPCNKPSERMPAVSTCPAALMVTFPATPPEDMVLSESVLVFTAPLQLEIVMFPTVLVLPGIGVNFHSSQVMARQLHLKTRH